MSNLKKVVTIAGSDTSGGAGIQADLKTFQERGVYGMNIITVLVTMDPKDWSHKVFPVDMNTIKEQANTVFNAIGVDAVKTGMLPTVEIINYAGELIKDLKNTPIVIDPVMVCKGVKEAAKKIYDFGVKNVVIKGGKSFSKNSAIDVLYDGSNFDVIETEKIDTPYTHGAGCSFAACMTAELAKGATVKEALETTKTLITEALRQSFKLGEFVGPLNHKAFALK